MIKERNNRQLVKVFILVIALIVLAFSSTYAYFSSNIGEPSTTTATSATFDIESTLDDASAIYNKRMVLIESNEIADKAESLTFTVTSKQTSNVGGQFNVSLKEISISKNLKSKDFHWELVKVGLNQETPIASGTFKDVQEKTGTVTSPEDPKAIVNVNDIKLNNEPIPLANHETVTLLFRMYLLNDPDVNQIDLTEGSFTGRLSLEAVPVSALNN